MAHTAITEAYQYLELQMPEYMDAINFCLVAGGIRPGTWITPYRQVDCAFRPVSEKVINQALRAFPEIKSRRFMDAHRHRSAQIPTEPTAASATTVLVYHQSQQNLVNQLPPDLSHQGLTELQSVILGKILGYHCPGELAPGVGHIINYMIPNPWTGNPNGILGQSCGYLTEERMMSIINFGQQMHDFFQANDLDFPVILEIFRFKEIDGEYQKIIEYTQDYNN